MVCTVMLFASIVGPPLNQIAACLAEGTTNSGDVPDWRCTSPAHPACTYESLAALEHFALVPTLSPHGAFWQEETKRFEPEYHRLALVLGLGIGRSWRTRTADQRIQSRSFGRS
jgi:hypothetical protein